MKVKGLHIWATVLSGCFCATTWAGTPPVAEADQRVMKGLVNSAVEPGGAPLGSTISTSGGTTITGHQIGTSFGSISMMPGGFIMDQVYILPGPFYPLVLVSS